ncbi:MAG: lipoyl(octanoyl) transferase LipB [Bacteroidota bacterium]|nr:lipoyl(octanoyl) transferase LipB [Bacteroidota bacterium]
MVNQAIRLHDLGVIPYRDAWKYQTQLQEELIANKKAELKVNNLAHSLILCEHPHVFTLGKSGEKKHLLANPELLDQIGAEYVEINRGGDITYHGPGQLVVYPILDLEALFRDVHKYVRYLEETVIRTLDSVGIVGERISGLTGVWLDVDKMIPRKICAIGVHLSRWVSLHGIAFNVNTNLVYFDYIIPCGINPKEKSITSLEKELGEKVDMKIVKEIYVNHFLNVFELELIK